MNSRLLFMVISALCALKSGISCPVFVDPISPEDPQNIVDQYLSNLELMGRIFVADTTFIHRSIITQPNATLADLQNEWSKKYPNFVDINHIQPIDLLLRDLMNLKKGIDKFVEEIKFIKKKSLDKDAPIPARKILEELLKSEMDEKTNQPLADSNFIPIDIKKKQ